MMENKRFNEWFIRLGEAWSERNPQKAASLFSKDVEYYESVFDKPCASWNEVYELWKVVPESQKDVTFEHELIAVNDNLAVANWKVTRTTIPANQKQKFDGVFVIKLNSEGLRNYFKQ